LTLGVPKSILHRELTPLEKKHSENTQLFGLQIGRAESGVKMMDYLKDENDISWPDFSGEVGIIWVRRE
jgi:hypothetical protein